MSIECVRCGNCCPTTCDRFIVEQENPQLTTCVVHDEAGKRGYLCRKPPEYFYTAGIACRAILGDEEIEVVVSLAGQVLRKNR